MLSFVKFVLVLTLALQCQGFCGEDDHYTKVPKVTVANSTHLRVSWHRLFSGCYNSDVQKMTAVSSHMAHQGGVSAAARELDFEEREGFLPLNPCLEYKIYLKLMSHDGHSYRTSKSVKYNDVSRPNIASLYGGLLPDENYMGSVCLKKKGVITFPDPPEALSECILTRGDQAAEEFSAPGQTFFVPLKILHPTSQMELEITARVNRILDCTLTTTRTSPTTDTPSPTTNNQNISSPPNNDPVQAQEADQPKIIAIASIFGTLALAVVAGVTTAVCFIKKRNRVERAPKVDTNDDYGFYYSTAGKMMYTMDFVFNLFSFKEKSLMKEQWR